MTGSIQYLREVTRRCLAREPLDPQLTEWLGRAFNAYLTRSHRTLDEAMGLVFPQGGVPWWLEEAMRERDLSLRELCCNFISETTTAARARAVRALSLRYAASAWRTDRNSHCMPAHYAGTIKEYLWRAFASGAPMPLGERQLRTILAT